MAIDTLGVLRRVALFRSLPETELTALGRQMTPRLYGRNELIFSQGDPGDGLYIVTHGHVSISRQSPDGGELILTLEEPGEYFGELALFDDEPRSASASAVEPTALLFLARQGFREFLRTHPAALFPCLEVIVRQLRRLTDLVDELALLDVRARLARRLLRLSDQGAAGNGGRIGTLHITQQQLANMTGATRESVNKHLNALMDAGIIRLERGAIRILDRKRLEESSEGMG